MTVFRTAHVVLLGVGILALVKAVWGLAAPGSLVKAVRLWSRIFPKVNTLAGVFCFSLAAALWALVLIGQPLAYWLLALLGLALGLCGFLYLKPDRMQQVLSALILDRGNAVVRILAAAAGAVAILLVIAAVRGLR